MASYSTSLRLVLPTTGEYPGSWGTQVNNGLTNLVDTAIAGTATIIMTAADYTLSTANGASDEARAMTLNLTGTPGAARNVICPAVSKLYIVYNNTTGGFAQTVKTASGTGISVPNGATAFLRCDGTNVVAAVNYFGSLTLGTVTGGTFVSPALTGTPTAPTAAGGTATTQIATTAFVDSYYAKLASPAFTGVPTAPTATAGTSTTQLATTAFVTATAFSPVLPGQTGNAGNYLTTDGTNASWAAVYPTLTGNSGKFLGTDGITVSWSAVYPTQTGNNGKFLTTDGTTTSWADTNPSQTGNSGKFLSTNGTVTSWADVLPSQTSNSGKYLTTNGTTSSWAFAGISQVTTATTSTTLTSTPTLLQITPTGYGVTVTLPDATTCTLGGPLHCIDNRSVYPVRVLNTSGTLLGFVFGNVASYISLDNNSTAAGVWSISNNELVGPSSTQLNTANIIGINACIDLGSNQEIIIGRGGSGSTNIYGVVYNRSTNTFGSVTLIRTGTFNGFNYAAAVLSAANQVLVVSCPTSAATFEAVTLSISGTTITVNTAATATLSANINNFSDGCGLIAVGSSFVTSYTVITTANQIRALSISGTTVTIGAASVVSGGTGGLSAAASSSILIAVGTNGTTLYVTPYTVSGSTLTVGTGATITPGGTVSIFKLAPLGTRWYIGYGTGSVQYGGVISLSGTTATISTTTLVSTGNSIVDSIVVGSNKVLVLIANSGNSVNILTDTAGTASAGTPLTLTSETQRACLYVSGTDVVVYDGTLSSTVFAIDCSGASPTIKSRYILGTGSAPNTNLVNTSNSVLSKSGFYIYGANFVSTIALTLDSSTAIYDTSVKDGAPKVFVPFMGLGTVSPYRGRTDSERWCVGGVVGALTLTKWECVA